MFDKTIFDVFGQNADKTKERKEGVEDLYFDALTAPKGKEMLKHLKSRTTDREFKLPPPRTADELVNFVVHYAVRYAQNDLVEQMENEVKKATDRKAKGFVNN